MSEYGKQSAYKISYELAAAEAVIVSGMALGIDGVSACGALAAKGDTVAVLGCGIRVVYPKEHKTLMEEIAKRGAVLTEYPPDERPNGHHFPTRNRIISGLCQGVLVVEGATGSGALITATKAMAQGREVFALPGKINDNNSYGPNELIRNGAYPVLSSGDIVQHYDFLYHDVIRYRALATAEKKMPTCETVLERYGVSDRTCRGASEAKPSESKRDKKEKREERSAEPTVQPTPAAKEADASAQVLEQLDDMTRRVFSLMPLDHAVSVDLFAASGIGIGDAVTSLTLLELNGLVSSLPGGMYIRK